MKLPVKILDPAALEESPYQTPGETAISSEAEAPPLYIVSTTKLIVLYVMTMGIYQTYWFYKNWRLYKNSMHADILPMLRSVFYIFFIHSLFRKTDLLCLKSSAKYPSWYLGGLATLWVVMSIATPFIESFSTEAVDSILFGYFPYFMLIPNLIFLVLAQLRINEACGEAKGKSNSNFTLANYFWIVYGAIMWVVVAIDLLGPQRIFEDF